MFDPAHHRSRGHRRHRRRRIGVIEFAHEIQHQGKIVPIQGLRRHLEEIALVEEELERPVHHLPRRRQGTVAVAVEAAALCHQVVERRVGRPGVEGQERARLFRRGMPRVDPGEIAHPAEVQERQRRLGADPLGAGEVEERRQRRPLPAQPHVVAAEIPDHRHPQRLSQSVAVAQLVRAAPVRVMRQRLTVEAHEFGPLMARQRVDMRALDHVQRCLQPRPRPAAQNGPQLGALGLGIGAVGGGSEVGDGFSVGAQHRRIHTVERGARHRPQRPDRPAAQHGLFLRPSGHYSFARQ